MASARLLPGVVTYILLLLAILVNGQQVSPQNDIANGVRFIMDTRLNSTNVDIELAPLIDQAGRTGGLNELRQITTRGPLFVATNTTVKEVNRGNIVLVSCEARDFEGALDIPTSLNLVREREPSAIILYSTLAASCSYAPSDDFSFGPMYTMLNATTSQAVIDGVQIGDSRIPYTKIHVDETSVNGTQSGNNNGGSVLGRSPTTAVAMIILYSITGIITALFLVIIVVGAIRAHRHPERYGPRHVIGRPRQSRAKGIARAMLETLPIVKFGDKEEEKPPGPVRDVELGPANVQHHENVAAGTDEPKKGEALPEVEDASPATKATTTAAAGSSLQPNKDLANPIDSRLACSVCTDDFVKGQDIRVLPCKHKFHPDCIDPWLLNVSGTCPLCRIDLQPKKPDEMFDHSVDGPSLETRIYGPEPDNGTVQNNDITRRNRRSRILSTLNIGRMRHATPQERIEALRTLRREGMAGVDRSEQGAQAAEEQPTNRFSRRLSRALGSRPPSELHSRPVSGLPPAAAADPTSSTLVEVPSNAPPANPGSPEITQRR